MQDHVCIIAGVGANSSWWWVLVSRVICIICMTKILVSVGSSVFSQFDHWCGFVDGRALMLVELFCVKGEFVCPLGINLDRTACLKCLCLLPQMGEQPKCEKDRKRAWHFNHCCTIWTMQKNCVSLWRENVEDQKPFKDVAETQNDVTSC